MTFNPHVTADSYELSVAIRTEDKSTSLTTTVHCAAYRPTLNEPTNANTILFQLKSGIIKQNKLETVATTTTSLPV